MDFPAKTIQIYVDNIQNMAREIAYFQKEIPNLNPHARKASATTLYGLKSRLELYLQKSKQLKEKKESVRPTLQLTFSNLFEHQQNQITNLQQRIDNIITEHKLEQDSLCSFIFLSDAELFKSIENGIDTWCESQSLLALDLSLNNSDTYCCKRDHNSIP